MTGISDSQVRSPVAVEPGSSNFVRQLRWASIIISLVVIGLGCSVILGWLLDITVLKSITADRVAMSLSTAVGIVLGGISLLLWHQRQKRNSSIVSVALYLLPSLAIACSLFSLIDFATGSLFYLNSAVTVTMSPNTAISLLCFNIAILLLLGRFYLIAQLLALLVAAIASVSLIGHIYDITSFYRVDPIIGMAIHTAIALILLVLAFLGTCSTKGWMRVITREEAGGIMARWLLPLVIIIPPLLGGIFWSLFRDRIYDLELIVAPRILLEMSIFGSIVWWTARKLNYSDRQKQYYYRQLLETEARYKAIVEDQTELICRYRSDSTISYVNDAFCRYFDLEREQLIDRQYTPVVYEADRPRVAQLIGTMNSTNPTVTVENRVVVKTEIPIAIRF